MSSRSSWGSTIFTIAVTSVAVVTTYSMARLIKLYGLEGAGWYIWEGSPYPPNVRTYFYTLDKVKDALQKGEEQTLEILEESLERAKLNCIDGSTNTTIVNEWNSAYQSSSSNKKSLEQTLAKLSYDLDKRAAQVDDVKSVQRQDLKQCKKQLSNHIVQLMERVDILMALYKESLNASKD